MQRRNVGVTLGELAKLVNGTVVGDEGVVICGLSEIESATQNDLVVAMDRRCADAAFKSNAAAVLVPRGLESEEKPCIVCEHPKLALAAIAELFSAKRFYSPGVSRLAIIDETAKIAKGVSIAPFCFIGPMSRVGEGTIIYPFVYIGADVSIGCNCLIYPGAVIYDGVHIGDRVIIHANAVLGKDGFGFVWDGMAHRRIPQIGGVIIEDDVEIGANSCVDRATLGVTRVRKGTKIDNLVQVAHNCDVGEHCILCGMSGLAGSVKVGKGVIIGAQAGIKDHVSVGDGAIIAGRAAVAKDVASGETVSGYPARPHREALVVEALTHQLPKFREALKKLESEVTEIKALLLQLKM
ncbi:MAG: UDP-3-O-(3-hydroxymyristoyl)glucosamine N-acyltransferase [Armatimonadota bacterium]|nr:UDP-3-O-(3-hydroxymyristoyl)glucosamine N-acyltransferase [Armatimonadota bacterium]MCX7777796.1 UDP-3-O-(3-hydroxymyristoyl)glucosamine N-acyltransferase [Armatimonadota bacterium]MDW8025317.1 UDP-3-O-(3-hydroxymyristoyl)glucosamine N-acyltransferase [Armatimonadota bacterium]